MLTTPAENPFAIAICIGSEEESLRVRLLSMPHARQAPAMKAAPASTDTPRPSHDRRAAPSRMEKAPKQEAAVDVFPKHQPCNAHRGEPFEIQQQRTRGGVGQIEAEHQEKRPQHAAEQNNGGKPRNVRAPERRFGRGQAYGIAGEMHASQADSGTKVEQSGKQLRVNDTQQYFREWSGRAKHRSRSKRQRYAGPQMREVGELHGQRLS